MNGEDDENTLIQAIENLSGEISDLEDSTRKLRGDLAIIHNQTLVDISKKIDGLESEISSLKEIMKRLLNALEHNTRVMLQRRKT